MGKHVNRNYKGNFIKLHCTVILFKKEYNSSDFWKIRKNGFTIGRKSEILISSSHKILVSTTICSLLPTVSVVCGLYHTHTHTNTHTHTHFPSLSLNVICKWIYPFYDIGVDLWTNRLNHVQNIFVVKKGDRERAVSWSQLQNIFLCSTLSFWLWQFN